MPGTAGGGARTCCERLIAELEGSDIPRAGFVTVSAGVATHRAGTTIERLLAAAAARPRPRPRRRRRPRRGAPGRAAASNPFRAQAARHRGARHRAASSATATPASTPRSSSTWPGPSPPTLGLDEVEVERVGHAALLHDIGKVGDARPRPAQARPAGRRGVGRSCASTRSSASASCARSRAWAASRGSCATSTSASTAPATPTASRGEEIPLGSRIILACDAYHAMTSDRPYRAAMAHEDAVAELVRCAGTQFDPRIVAALVSHLGRGDGEPRFTTPLTRCSCGDRLAGSTGRVLPESTARRCRSTSPRSDHRAPHPGRPSRVAPKLAAVGTDFAAEGLLDGLEGARARRAWSCSSSSTPRA